MPSTYIRNLGDKLNEAEAELFRLITNQEESKVKPYLQLHKNDIDFSKKGTRGYSLLQTAVLTQNRNILAYLLATRQCEPIDKALLLATEIQYQQGVNVFLKYINSKNRLLCRRLTVPNDIHRASANNLSAPDQTLPEAEIPASVEKDLEGELFSDGPVLLPDIRESVNEKEEPRSRTIVGDVRSRSRSRGLLRSNTSPGPSYYDANLPTSNAKEKEDIIPQPLLANVLTNPADILKKAAISEDYNTTANLLNSGIRLRDPLDKDYESEAPAKDSLLETVDRIETLRASSSATFISLTAEDPITTAFNRSVRLWHMSYVYPENKDEYVELSEKNSKFAVSLLSLCQSSEEVEQLMLLQSTSTSSGYKFGRLQTAVNCSQKNFITHSYCQHIATSFWLKGLPQWQRWSSFKKMAHVFLQALLMPFVAFFTIIAPNSSVASPASVPLNRFLYAATSYSIFLIFLLSILLSSVGGESSVTLTFHWLSFAYVLSTWIRILTCDISIKGAALFRRFWPLYEIFMYFVFTVAFVLILFFRHLDPVVSSIGDGLLSIGFILAVAKTLEWVQLHRSLGPFIIAFSKIIGSLIKLLVILLILYVSFTIGIYYLYRDQISPMRGASDEKDENFLFNSFSGVVKALFWTLYGYGEANYPDIPSNSSAREATEQHVSTDDRVTQWMGFVLWGLFHIACVTIVFNMLIALMTNKYQKVEDHCDSEWKYVRTEFWLYYFEECNRIPPPFNVLLFIQTAVMRIFGKKTNSRVSEVPTDSMVQWRQIEPDSSKHNVTVTLTGNTPEESAKKQTQYDTYSDLIKVLIERYFQETDVQSKRAQQK